MNLNENVILNISGSDYHCIISLINKNEAINILQNADLTKKKWNIIKHKKFIFIYKKWAKKLW